MLAALVAILATAQGAEARSSTTAVAGGLAKLPALVVNVEAPYPERALAEGREGTVTLAIDVDEEGEVVRVEVLESAGSEFDAPAMEAAAGFRFTPAEAFELGPVPVRIVYRYGFVLRRETARSSTVAEGGREALASPNPGERTPAPPINFMGTLREAGTRTLIPFARVEISISTTATTTRTSTDADAEGRFSFRGIPAGKHVVTVTAPLFERFDTKEEVRSEESIEVLYYLTRRERNPYEVVVRTKLDRREVARRRLVFEEVERLPGTQGDAIRVIQNLPGVARAPFGLGLLIVRGAQPQDTGVFLDGHWVPILFHFGGLGGVTSVVNARMLDAIDFHPGGFGPEVGRISAGAVELRSKFARTDRVHGEAVVDIGGASLFLEGPVTRDESDGAFVLALRRSYVDGVLAGITSAADSSIAIAPRYWDYQARYDRPLGGKRRTFTLLAYGSDDEFVVLGTAVSPGEGPSGTESRTYFHRLNPRFTYSGSGETSLVISPIIGIDHSNVQTSGDATGNSARFILRDVNAGLRVDGSARLLPFAKLRAGGDVLYFLFTSESELPAFPRANDFPGPIPTDVPPRRDQTRVPALLGALYGELELTPIEDLTLWPGLRLDVYRFSADPQPLLDPRLIEGRTLVGLDPRLTSRYRLSDGFELKGQAGIYQQPPLPPQLYINADLPLQLVDQYSVGFEVALLDRLSLDLQGFYRKGRNVPRTTTQLAIVDGVVRPVGFRPDGERRAFGMELLLKLEKRWGLFGWIAYTLSRSEFRRRGEGYVPNYFTDQTHNLNIVASYDLGLNWFASVRFRYVTAGGLPETSLRWYDADQDAYDRDVTTEQRRAPAFHQLDIRIDKRWVFDEWYLEAYLDVQNVYNRDNTEFYVPTFDFKNEVAIPSLPVFPLLGVKGVF